MRDGARLPPVILFTTANIDGYRSHLVRALADRGHEVSIVLAQRNPVLQTLGAESRRLSPLAFARWLRGVCRRYPNAIVLNSTTISFPITSAILRATCGGLWCFDLYDHFGTQGLTAPDQLRRRLAQRFVHAVSDFTIRPCHTSIELLPSSLYLPSASHVRRVERPAPDFGRVLVLASFDQRTDWKLLDELADLAPGREIDLVGRVYDFEKPALDALLARRANVRHLGAYRDADLDSILSRYSVMVAPYIVNSDVTRYIDPNRYRHGLNSGLEVITTEVPQAHAFGDKLHIARDATHIAAILDRLEQEPSTWRSIGRDLPCDDWHEVAVRFIELAETVRRDGRPGTHSLAEEIGGDPRVLALYGLENAGRETP